MKQHLLIWGLFLLPALGMAQANLVHGVSALTTAAMRKKLAHRPASHGKKEVSSAEAHSGLLSSGSSSQ
ncbi:hypothetical protein LRS06_20030 [Hymenobacter sp. J193]|uniref:hypothetical protein n=1 Tax=Hymenobacter sp. J193 TaxID=2898429 RepID=UPI002150BF64|nr:hypothetical protein [Hymenobacter sp. J193]MCR5890019.1 hypothetical protein [Hymenobacter sp. J193]